MTEYIDIDAFDDDEIVNKEGGDDSVVEKLPMSMGQLDAALANLINNGGSKMRSSRAEEISTMEITTKCALCGKGFPGPIELGEHMALCTGLMDNSIGVGDSFPILEEEITTAAFSTPQFLGDDTGTKNITFNDGDFEDYDDYDVQI